MVLPAQKSPQRFWAGTKARSSIRLCVLQFGRAFFRLENHKGRQGGPVGGSPPGIIDHNDIIKFMQWKFSCKLGIRARAKYQGGNGARHIFIPGYFKRDYIMAGDSQQKTGIVFLIEQCLFDIVI